MALQPDRLTYFTQRSIKKVLPNHCLNRTASMPPVKHRVVRQEGERYAR